MTVLYTIGYEGTDIDRFIETLKIVGVTVLADVRAIPLSRKKGFSKSALQARLEGEGIDYVHFVALGDPKPGRDAARAGQHAAFRRIYSRHLETREAGAALQELAKVATSGSTCLLCFERNPLLCHRSLITNRLSMNGVKAHHLSADDPSRYAHASKQPRHDTRQGASAA